MPFLECCPGPQLSAEWPRIQRNASLLTIQSVQRKGLTGRTLLWTREFLADPGARLKAGSVRAPIFKALHKGHVAFAPFLDTLRFISKKILPLLIHHQAKEF